MPTPTASVRSRVLDSLVAILQAVNGPTTTYFNAFVNVTRVASHEPKEFPYLLVRGEGAVDEQVASREAYTVVDERYSFAVDFQIPDRETTAPVDVETVVHDIKKAICLNDTNRRHGGLAFDTYITGDTIDTPVAELPGCSGTVKGIVRLRYRDSDPSSTA